MKLADEVCEFGSGIANIGTLRNHAIVHQNSSIGKIWISSFSIFH